MRKFLTRYTVPISVIGVFFVAFFFFNFTCPIYFIFDVPCPACGVTRAMLSLLRLDFSAYLEYNAMAIPLVMATLLMLLRKRVKHRLLLHGFVTIVLVLNSVYYIFRLLQ